MHVTLVNPNLHVQRNDPFTTGVVYMPIGLAYAAAALRQAGVAVSVVDAFGERPQQARRVGNYLVLGLTAAQFVAQVPTDTQLVVFFANQVANHDSLAALHGALKASRPTVATAVLENTQAVTAYALGPVAALLWALGFDFLVAGEPEERLVALARAVQAGDRQPDIDGVAWGGRQPVATRQIADLDALPFPAWDLLPVRNYWGLHFAHGPLTSDRYLPILSSRGCPYPCKFCVVPATNDRKWRARSASNVADELQHWKDTLGVQEFHFEDLDPTVKDQRTRDLCQQIQQRQLKVTWKLVAGTKVETLRDEETIAQMAAAGCRYISISPESGSPRVLKLMNKPFKVDHAVRLVHKMNEVGIASQCCFVVGFPGETDDDRQMTLRLVERLVDEGVDEIAVFLIAPVPGSAIFADLQGWTSLSQLNFTPTWRQDYPKLAAFRLLLYRTFLLRKLRRHPQKILRQAANFALRRFDTKMEMVPFRALVYKARDLAAAS